MESEFGIGRARFVSRLPDGEIMTEVWPGVRHIPARTGYKICDHYGEHWLEALSGGFRRPVRYANQLPHQLEALIVRLKSEKLLRFSPNAGRRANP